MSRTQPGSQFVIPALALVGLMALIAIFLPGTPRVYAATITVNSTADPGDGVCDATECTLREAIAASNASVGVLDTIAFNIPGTGPYTISPVSALPTITDPVFIDGYTQSGSSPNTNSIALGSNAVLLIELDGSSAVAGANGLYITAGGSRVRGLVINNFIGCPHSCNFGIRMDNNGGNLIEGNYIGTDVGGTVALFNSGAGVYISHSPNNTIGGLTPAARNIISGNFLPAINTGVGVQIVGGGATGNVVQGNFIGVDITGATALPNSVGVAIGVSASNNTIGGTSPEARNIISGNVFPGIGLGGFSNLVQGNYIGTDVTGTKALGNGAPRAGVDIVGSNNIVGGTTPGARNIISGNNVPGVMFDTINSTGNVVQGNYIGTDVTGKVALPNKGYGVTSNFFSSNNTVGGTAPGAGNLISGNTRGGVGVGQGAHSLTVQGNYIGTDVTGTLALANLGHGVTFDAGSDNNTIGGTTTGARNIISGNTGRGLFWGSSGNLVQGNYIGTDVTGTVAMGNGFAGLQIAGPNNTIGGTTPGAGNIISASAYGLYIQTGGNVVQGNYIGTDATGTKPLGNTTGVFLPGPNNTIGGTTAGARNIISGNSFGVVIQGSGATGNVVQGNYIGTDVSGSADLGNTSLGVVIFSSASNNAIGGTGAGAGNTIAFNGLDGVFVRSAVGKATTDNSILSNSIFSNTNLGINLAAVNSDGVTANDAGDADTGANNLQNFPVVTSASSVPSSTTVVGSLNSTPSMIFTVQFFSNSACDTPSGHGEGETFLGSTSVTTDGTGNVSFSATVPGSAPIGQVVTATATDPAGNTSEFSSCSSAVVSGNSPPTANAGPDQPNVEWTGDPVALDGTGSGDPDGDPLTYQWSAPGITFDDPTSATPSAIFPLGATTVTLVVNDGTVDSAQDTVDITVVDTTAPTASAALVPIDVDDDEGLFRVEFSCTDTCDENPTITSATLNGVAVSNDQIVELEVDDDSEVEWDDGILEFEAPSFELVVTCEDESGNIGSASASPIFAEDDDDDGDDDDDEDDDEDEDEDDDDDDDDEN